ncbi:class I SAM-dependent methyltransferase [Micromonospora sp. NBC_01796]|uniref:class I SAM-dependent methyltransferase n=1 Tax=Micromonospora sp. NBC_01796 TaxID=2975987 RepID=UPI002DDC3513|nr:class I SAM-dependent methyltransferase [Micromonospora sp. NBC_01796]WSA85584.1 class I SAM-dependent methyltransferase [Micromonospora sp. NBC_01796]
MTTSTRPSVPPHGDKPSYSFDNNDPAAADRHNFLAEMLDEPTFARLSELGDLTGRRCLELGAGGGSVARWLAARTGPTGTVVATDLNPRHIPDDPGYTVLRHDLKDPLPDGPWDLVHARLVLMHVPQRREVMRRLVDALAPGGVLVIEDWLTSAGKLVLAAPDDEAEALIDAYQETLVGQVLTGNGTDSTWAAHIHSVMLAEGLVDVDTVIHSRSWPGGTAGALLVAANVAQVRTQMLTRGFTEPQLETLQRLVHDPRLVVRGHLTYSTVGWRDRAPG